MRRGLSRTLMAATILAGVNAGLTAPAASAASGATTSPAAASPVVAAPVTTPDVASSPQKFTGCSDPARGAWPQYMCAAPGELLDVRIGDVHPTQPSLGYDEVYYKLGRYTLGKDVVNKKFDDWCEADGRVAAIAVSTGSRLDDPSSFRCELPRGGETADSTAAMKTVVIGPGGEPFLTDGHHTLTAFYETPGGGANLHLRLRVVANYSALKKKDFWAQMQAHQWVYLKDPLGRAVKVNQLPTGVGLTQFQDDPYRSLLYFGRDIGYEANGLAFQEFYWGSWVRDSAPVCLSGWNRTDLNSYLSTVQSLTQAMTALPSDRVVDAGFSAAQLGALEDWNGGKAADKGEFAKLSRPFTDAKPGKLAYALQYKQVHGLK